MLLDIKSWCLLCNAHTLIIPAVCHFECFVICIFSSITRNFQIFIRVRNAGASGRECSALAGRHYLPPRQASFTSFFNKENKLQLSGRRAWIPSSLRSVCNQDNSPMGRTFGRVSPLCKNLASLPWGSSLLRRTGRLASVIADEDFTLDLKQGTPWTSNHGAGVRCFISAHEKIFRIDLWAKTRSSGVARMRERRGGPALLWKRHCAPSGGEKTNNNHSQKNCMWNSITSFYIRNEVSVKVVSQDTMTRIVNFKYCPLCKTYFCDDCLRR